MKNGFRNVSAAFLVIVFATASGVGASPAGFPLGLSPSQTPAQILGPVECPGIPFEGTAVLVGPEQAYVAFVDMSARWVVVTHGDLDRHELWVVNYGSTPEEPWTKIDKLDDTGYPLDNMCQYILRALRDSGRVPKPGA